MTVEQNPKSSVWFERFAELRDMGVSEDAAHRVFRMLDDARAFGSDTHAQKAQTVLAAVYSERGQA